jgi:hypothetical protein
MEKLIYNQFPFWNQGNPEFDRLWGYLHTNNTNNFYLNKAPAENMWHKYDLPFIGISDEDKNIESESWLDNVLGFYQSQDDDMWEKEGRIVLFRKNILKVAEKYTDKKGGDVVSNFIFLTKIVLLHELGHWIFHYMPIYSKNSTPYIVSNYNKTYKYINTDLQEAIAQHFVKKGIGNDIDLTKMFDWLCNEQAEVYKTTLPGDLVKLITLIMQKDEKNICTNLTEYPDFIFNKRGAISGIKFNF